MHGWCQAASLETKSTLCRDSHCYMPDSTMLTVPRLTFFVGKGGVGKTTVSAAYAVHLAQRHPRQSVLVLSTDPAHSLADVLDHRLGDTPQRVPLAGARLFAWQVNAAREFEKFQIGRASCRERV